MVTMTFVNTQHFFYRALDYLLGHFVTRRQIMEMEFAKVHNNTDNTNNTK